MAIEAIIWDVGGVLVRTENPEPREALARGLGVSRFELEEMVFGGEAGHRAQRGEVDYKQHWEYLRELLKFSNEELIEFRNAFWEGDRLDTALIDYIRSLQNQYRTGLLSNAFSDLRRMLFDVWKIADAFDELVISADEGVMKPDPQIYLLAVDRLNVAPENAVFIDDFERNIIAAREFGLHGILFRSPEQVRQDLNDLLDGS